MMAAQLAEMMDIALAGELVDWWVDGKAGMKVLMMETLWAV